MIVNSKEILKKANMSNYSIPSPDFVSANMVRDYVEVAEEVDMPLILAISETLVADLPLQDAFYIGKYYAEKAKVPVVLHIDHGRTIEFIKEAIDLGFTSVMIDASVDSFEENIRKTKEIVDYAHTRNVTVEAEIGHVGSNRKNIEDDIKTEDDNSIYTEVKDLVKFVELTNVDSVAVSVGTAHGIYNGTPKINFERLKELKAAVSIPLVLHGGSSSGDDNLKKCAEIGISKTNIFTDLCVAGASAVNKLQPDNYRDTMKVADLAIKQTLRHYYGVFNCTK